MRNKISGGLSHILYSRSRCKSLVMLVIVMSIVETVKSECLGICGQAVSVTLERG